ncbi:MAG: TonB-dependent receptor [Nitrospirota bacterium]
MYKNLLIPALIMSLLLTAYAFAEEKMAIEIAPVVVTASKVEEPASEASASVDVITSEIIEDKQALTLDEALRGLTGTTVNSHGGADPLPHILLRGTNSNQSLILLDGIKINPPYSDLHVTPAGILLLDSIDRIEVVKGSHSALYGSDAIGGVVNAITRYRPGLTFNVNSGTHATFNNSLIYSGRYNDTTYTLGQGMYSTEGFIGSGPYRNNTLLGKINIPLDSQSSLQLSSYYWNWVKYDHNIGGEINSFSPLIIKIALDEDSNLKEESWIVSAKFLQFPSGQWKYYIGLTTYNTHSIWSNPLDPATADRPFPLAWDSDISSARDTIEMQHDFYVGENNTVTAGIQYTREWLGKEESNNFDTLGTGPSVTQPDIRVDRSSRAIYLQDLFKVRELLSLAAGVRYEDGPGFDNELIPGISALFIVPETEIEFRLSYGQGIRAAALDELYHPVAGNANLKPEKSKSSEAGIRLPVFNHRLWAEATFFILQLENLIDTDYDQIPPVLSNIGKAEIRGAELELHFTITDKLSGNVGYTRLSTENKETGEHLPLRPDYKWVVDLIYKSEERLTLSVNAEITGRSFEPFLSGLEVIGLDGKPLDDMVAGHKVVNMAATYNIIKGNPVLGNLDCTLKLNNILNTEYEEIPGFAGDGFTFLAGIRSTY